MSFATRLAIVAAALVVASSAHAFTYNNQGTTSTYGGQGGGSSYGGTLTDPGSQIRNYGSGVDLSTPGTAPTNPPQGFSLRFDSGPFGSNRSRLAPPRWSTDPLYLERGGE
jgi:hypothetical protein